MRALNEAYLSRQDYNAVSEFAAVAAKGVTGGVACSRASLVVNIRRCPCDVRAVPAADQRRSTMGSLWSVLESIFREVSDTPAGSKARTAAMLRGACKYLEAGHVQYIQRIISVNRTQVRLCTHAPAVKLSTACKATDSGPSVPG